MANEINFRAGLNVRKGNLQYTSSPAGFNADMDGFAGPSPGAIIVTVGGTDVDLSQLTTPSSCFIQNVSRLDGVEDEEAYVTVGIWEPDTELFYPLLELLPGEGYPVRLSRDLTEQYEGTGTGTGPSNNRLRIRAHSSTCIVKVDAFDR